MAAPSRCTSDRDAGRAALSVTGTSPHDGQRDPPSTGQHANSRKSQPKVPHAGAAPGQPHRGQSRELSTPWVCAAAEGPFCPTIAPGADPVHTVEEAAVGALFPLPLNPSSAEMLPSVPVQSSNTCLGLLITAAQDAYCKCTCT